MTARLRIGEMVSLAVLTSLLALVPSEVPAQTVEVLHSFSGCVPTGCTDGDGGQHPASTLVKGPDGAFYGTTAGHSSTAVGTVFRITPGGAMTTLFSFPVRDPLRPMICPDGCYPTGTLTYGADGAFYGVTEQGGFYGDGTLFRITPNGHFTKLHDMDIDGNPANNGGPTGGLVQGFDGKLYGASIGGAFNLGRIFRLEGDGSITTVFSFSGTDGHSPRGDLVRASDGNIYGVAGGGGTADFCGAGVIGCGTVFRMSPSGTVTTVHSFAGTASYSPTTAPIEGKDGNLYGTTGGGGTGCGAAYRMTVDGTITLLHAFGVGHGGCEPVGTLLQGTNGDFYGATMGALFHHPGSVYQMSPAGAFSSLHDFLGPEGSRPFAGLVESDGYLYGTTYEGGVFNLGVVFRIPLPARNGTLSVTEDTPTDGTLIANYPTGALTFSIVANGVLGTATITDIETGAFTYTPNADANGNDTFTFKANNGTVDSNVATVNVEISPVNDAPVANNGTASTTAGVPVSGTLNATDVDDDPVTFSIVTSGSLGTAVITNAATGAYTYTPNPGQIGSDTITFWAFDGALHSNVASLTIAISAAENEAPVAYDSDFTAAEDRSSEGTLIAADPQGSPLEYAIVSNGTKGTATITDALTGSFRYVPNANANGNDSFTFHASDGQLDSNVATVTVTIVPVSDPPVAENARYCMNIGGILTGTLKATDADGDPMTFAITREPRRSTVRLDASTGIFRFTHDVGLSGGTFEFQFSATDSSGKSDSARVLIHLLRARVTPNCR